MTTEELAQIIATGDVPLSLRMDPQGRPQSGIKMALAARQSGQFAGMSYEQVLAQLKQNRAEADAAD